MAPMLKVAAFIHHLLIHFPVVLLVVAATLGGLGWKLKRDELSTVSRYALALGAITGIVAAIAGWIASHQNFGESQTQAVELHRNAALFAVAVAGVGAILAFRRKSKADLTPAFAAVAAIAVGVAAHLGGSMVHSRFELGRLFSGSKASVAEEVKQSDVPTRITWDSQVKRGEAVYKESCESCHGDGGAGTEDAARLVGPNAFPELADEHSPLTAKILLDYTKTEMPADDPGILSQADAEAVTAWMLSGNDVTPVISKKNAGALVVYPK